MSYEFDKYSCESYSQTCSERAQPRRLVIRRLQDCAHFHYENVSLNNANFEIHMVTRTGRDMRKWSRPFSMSHSCSAENVLTSVGQNSFSLLVRSNGRSFWPLFRTYEDFRFLDRWLHRCCFSRASSLLRELPAVCPKDAKTAIRMLDVYLRRFSALFGNRINCSSILNWLQMDNKGNKLLVGVDDSPVNIPAKAAAAAIREYRSRAIDELSFQAGAMISVIDMPPAQESNWWRGKRVNTDKGSIEVGFFPSQYVRLIGHKHPAEEQCNILQKAASIRAVRTKHGKLITFLRTFFSSRPSRIALKQAGIVKERVFGCDLGEHLHSIKQDVPKVLEVCSHFIEKYGIVDGIYRLNGSFTNIQKLRQLFDEHADPNIETETYINDVHAVSSLLKMYFRELPIPILTFDLFDRFVGMGQYDCKIRQRNASAKISQIRNIVQDLPPPNYRTLRYLMLHLSRLARFHKKTNMTARNLAIVWAPNLLKAPCRHASTTTSEANETELKFVQTVAFIAEDLIQYSDQIFADQLSEEQVSRQTDRSSLGGENGSLDNDPSSSPQHSVVRYRRGYRDIPNSPVYRIDNMVMNCDCLGPSLAVGAEEFIEKPNVVEQGTTDVSDIGLDNDDFSDDEEMTPTFYESKMQMSIDKDETPSFPSPPSSPLEDVDDFIDNQFAGLDSLAEDNRIYFNPPALLAASKRSNQQTLDTATVDKRRSWDVANSTESKRQSLPSQLLHCLVVNDADNQRRLKHKLRELARRYSAELEEEHFTSSEQNQTLSQSVSTFNLDHSRPCTVKERVRWLEKQQSKNDDSQVMSFARGEIRRTSVRELLSRFECRHRPSELQMARL